MVSVAYLLTNHTGGSIVAISILNEMTTVSLTKAKQIARILSVMSSGINF